MANTAINGDGIVGKEHQLVERNKVRNREMKFGTACS